MTRVHAVGAAVVLLTGGAVSVVQGQQKPAGGVQFSVVRRDLGKLKAGDATDTTFPIRNAGSTSLQVLGVETDCGCVVPEYPRTVAPGATETIQVHFEPQVSWSGRVEKTLRVRTSDPAKPEVRLIVVADVIPFVRMDPPSPLQIPVARGKSYEKVLRLVPREGITLRKPQSSSPLVTATLEPPAAGDAEHAYRLRLKIGPVNQAGDFSATVRVPTSEPRLPEAWVAVAALAMTGPVVNPNQVSIATMARPAENQEVSRLQVFTRGPGMRLLGVETGSPALRADVREVSAGHFYEVSLRAAGAWSSGPFTTTLRVRTDDKNAPELRVPFQATVR